MKVVAVLLFALISASFIASASASICTPFKTCQTQDSDKKELARVKFGKLYFPLFQKIIVNCLILEAKGVDCRDGCLSWECTRDRVHYRGEGCKNEVHNPCGGNGNFLKNVSLYDKSLIETLELIN